MLLFNRYHRVNNTVSRDLKTVKLNDDVMLDVLLLLLTLYSWTMIRFWAQFIHMSLSEQWQIYVLRWRVRPPMSRLFACEHGVCTWTITVILFDNSCSESPKGKPHIILIFITTKQHNVVQSLVLSLSPCIIDVIQNWSRTSQRAIINK